MPLSLFPYGVVESEELRMAAQLDGFPRFKCLTLPGASSLFPRLVSLSRSSRFVCRLLLPLLAWYLLPGAFPFHVFPLSSFIVRTPLRVSHIISQLQFSALLGRIINQSSINPCNLPRARYRVGRESSSLIKAWSSFGGGGGEIPTFPVE